MTSQSPAHPFGTNAPSEKGQIPAKASEWDVPKTRACLKCETQFESLWSGQRFCPNCKSKSSWRNAATPTHGRSRDMRRGSIGMRAD